MGIPDYTLVVGVDKKHLRQLSQTYQTWVLKKRDFFFCPMVAIYDGSQVDPYDLRIQIPHENLITVDWNELCETTYANGNDKWTSGQRHKMLAGFVYGAAYSVKTPYWLKLDTDVVATGIRDWIDPEWFVDEPAIVSHPWSFTKPPHQMLQLDRWVDCNKEVLKDLADKKPLELKPPLGSDRVRHKRIISWCAFFNTEFTKRCAEYAHLTAGWGKLPVPSQDGFMWYVAKRLGLPIRTASMKRRGFEHWSTEKNIYNAVTRVLNGQ